MTILFTVFSIVCFMGCIMGLVNGSMLLNKFTFMVTVAWGLGSIFGVVKLLRNHKRRG